MPQPSRQERLERLISDKLSPDVLTIQNESHRHNVPPNAETHFKIVIVSEQFSSLMRIARHRLVHQLLHDELINGLHAISLHLYTPKEWQQHQKWIPPSPDCKGGNNK